MQAIVGGAGLWAVAVLLTVLTLRGRMWVRQHGCQIALSMGSAVLALAASDAMLSLTGLVPTIGSLRDQSVRYVPSISTIHRLMPNQIVRRENAADKPVLVTINSRGFRGTEIAVPKPPGTLRIVILGGSQVFDMHHGEGFHWPSLVAEKLSSAGRPVDVVNAGVPGHRTVDSLGKLVTDLWTLELDVIVLCQAWNDIKYFSLVTANSPYRNVIVSGPRDSGVEPTGLDRLLCASALYRDGRVRLIQTIFGTEGEKLRVPTGRIHQLGVQQYRVAVEAVCDVGKSLGAVVVLCTQPRLPTQDTSDQDRQRIRYDFVGLPHEQLIKGFAECDRVILELAAKKECRVIDLSSAMTGRSDYFLDHVHFTAAGSRRAAQIVAADLRAILSDEATFVVQ